MADDAPAHVHNENGIEAVSTDTQKNTVTETVVHYCTCGEPVRSSQTSWPINTGGDG